MLHTPVDVFIYTEWHWTFSEQQKKWVGGQVGEVEYTLRLNTH